MDHLVDSRTFVMDCHVDHGVINQMSLRERGGGEVRDLPAGKLFVLGTLVMDRPVDCGVVDQMSLGGKGGVEGGAYPEGNFVLRTLVMDRPVDCGVVDQMSLWVPDVQTITQEIQL